MTDQPSDRGRLTPDQELAVSRMLAEAAGTEPMPDEVAVRLQAVLADLEAARSGESPKHGVTARSRRWPRMLLAAAAVLVVGYGVVNVAGHGSLSGSESADSTSAGSSAGTFSDNGAPEAADQGGDQAGASQDSAGQDGAGQDGSGQGDAGGSSPESQPQPGSADQVTSLAGLGRIPPRLRSERLDVGVRRALRVLAAQQLDRRLPVGRSDACRPPSTDQDSGDDSTWLPVLYDGSPAVLVSRPASGDLVDVVVYTCDGSALDRIVLEP